LLERLGYPRQVDRKTKEGSHHPDRAAHLVPSSSRDEHAAGHDVFASIDGDDNRQRLHSTLG